MRVAVTGSTGRLGTAVTHAARAASDDVLAWTRSELDLDRPAAAGRAVEAACPEVVVHCAAWTDVDGCAREPDLARRRNGEATGALARAAAAIGAAFVAVSTNEVFDGRRSDGLGYVPADATSPANPYGQSKLAGENSAADAYAGTGLPLWIVRTAWLFGPPGRDFPVKIIDAARAALAGGRPLQLVADEIGCPTFAADVAAAIVALIHRPESAGILHVVNTGHASRAGWARAVLAATGLEVATEDVPLTTWPRPSTPPRWGVLEPTALPGLGSLRPWQQALDEDLSARGLAAGAAQPR